MEAVILLIEEHSKTKGRARVGSVLVEDDELEPKPVVKEEQPGPSTPATAKSCGRARKAPIK